MGFLVTLGALIVKNTQVKRRQPLGLICELSLPLFFICGFTLLRALFNDETYPEGWVKDGSKTQSAYSGSLSLDTNNQTFATESFLQPLSDTASLCELLTQWTYDNNPRCGPLLDDTTFIAVTTTDNRDLQMAKDMVEWVSDHFCAAFRNHTMFYDDADSLQAYMKSNNYAAGDRPEVLAAVVFEQIHAPEAVDSSWRYQIRMNASVFADGDCGYPLVPSTRNPDVNKLQNAMNTNSFDDYLYSNFLTLQLAMDRYIIHTRTDATGFDACTTTTGFENLNTNCELFYAPQGVHAVPMPVRSYTVNGFYSGVTVVLSIMYLMAFLYPLFKILATMVEEKELKIKEGLAIMGVTETQICLSWYITYGVFYGLLIVPLAVIMVAGLPTFDGMFQHADWLVVYLFFYFFAMSIVSYCYFVSAFFSRAKTAGVVGLIAFFAMYFGYFGASSAARQTRTGLCVLPPIAFAYGIAGLGNMESAGLGVTFANMNDEYDGFDFATPFGFLFLDIVLYTTLGWYLHRVVPREWGVVLPWYFPVMPSYWLGSPPPPARSSVAVGEQESDSVERVPDQLAQLQAQNRCVQIKSLTKEFDTPTGTKVAVDGLNLTMYEGQIFALLGHNGAGKTTTINMLSGMMPASSGTANVCGYDITTQMSEVRQILGVCPQHDVLYKELTVKEHLELFGRIKGLSGQALQRAVDEKIHEVGLTEKRHVVSAALSGGMKRKLSVAIALIGGSKVVFLDEPTSGMDPYSRRFTWDVLRKNREGRVIILTTHFMDEADLLGDRIGIMGGGQLRCCGSSLFLKNRYGHGYNLTITKAAGCDAKKVLEVVRAAVPDARLLSNIGTEFKVQMPVSESQKFPDLLDDLTQRKDELAINEYGISVTTMEEIFIKVAREGDLQNNASAKARVSSVVHERRASMSHEGDGHDEAAQQSAKLRPTSSTLTQIKAVYVKRLLVARRDIRSVGCSIVFPLLLVLAGLCIIKYAGAPGPDPYYELTPAPYADDNHFRFTYVAAQVSSNATLGEVMGNLAGYEDVLVAPLAADSPYNGITEQWGYNYKHGMACPKPAFQSRPAEWTCAFASQYNIPQSLVAADAAPSLVYAAKDISQGWSSSPLYGGAVVVRSGLPATNAFEYVFFLNTTSTHAAPRLMNAMNDALAKTVVNNRIHTASYPFPISASTSNLIGVVNAFVATVFIMFSLAFVPAAMVAFVVREREPTHNAKHLQMLSGCEVTAYWVSNFLFDLTYFIPYAIGLIILIAAFGLDVYTENNGLGVIWMVALMLGFALPPFTYCVSYLFSSASSAQLWTVLLMFLTGFVLTLVAFIMSIPGIGKEVEDVNKSLKYVYRLFPGFCLGDSLYSLAFGNLMDEDGTMDPWDWDVCGANLLFLFLDFLVYSLVAVGIDAVMSYPALQLAITRTLNRLWGGSKNTLEEPLMQLDAHHAHSDVDVDVAEEERRVENSPADMVRVLGLKKSYGPKAAVRHLQFGIPKGECFGLLGINGAGKTTTLKMLTGDVVPSGGSARLAGLDVLTQLMDVRKVVGYCPQFDAITDLLTVREHLVLYARLKGVPERDIPKLVAQKISQMSLTEFENRLAGTLSGGNKRKLSVAIAIIGNPPIVFLDEPSTGMDPVARRFMWDVIAEISTSSRECTVILTTHAMEECEALCSQVAIMVGGRFRCLGNVQRLKSRFGVGFTVELKVAHESEAEEGEGDAAKEGEGDGVGDAASAVASGEGGAAQPEQGSTPGEHERAQRIVSFFNDHFSNEVVESSPTHLVFRLPQENLSVAQLFKAIETHKDALGIKEYSVSQTTLEQIFNRFASQQEEERAPAPGLMAVRGSVVVPDVEAPPPDEAP